MKQCKNCNSTIPNDSAFCPYCGSSSIEETQEDMQESSAFFGDAKVDRSTIIDLADSCLKLSYQYRSICKCINDCGALKPVDFLMVVSSLEKLSDQLDTILVKLPDEKTYANDALVNNLILYADMFSKTILIDVEINRKLLRKSRGGSYGYLEYKKDCKEINSYHRAIEALEGSLINSLQNE